MSLKTLIIGGVAGGATAATRLRRRDANMQIIMFEQGEYISFANCGLPYYIGDVIKSREALLLLTPKAMMKKYGVEVRVLSRVKKIIPDDKKIIVKNLQTGEEYEESYDKLVIATGSTPVKPPILGIDSADIFTLWTVPDTDKIKSYINEKHPKKAAVIGGGFIGLEMAENLKEDGLEVVLIEMQNQVMAPIDVEMANLVHENIIMNHVELILEDGVKKFQKEDDGTRIELLSGKNINVDMVILSIGVKPNSELAKTAGIKTNEKGGIWVDDYLQTSAKDIFAVGDVIEVDNFITKDKTMIPLAGPANKQARIAADNIAGDKKKYSGTLGTAIAKVFDLNVASAGMNEKQLITQGKEKNKDYYTILINQKSHASYYPGSTPITLKMIFDKLGRIYGAQIVGQDGVDKRIDTLATTIRMGGTVADLAELELAYAPPFSSAKDPVNMLGFVAENVINGFVSFTDWNELDELTNDNNQKGKFTILDVTEEAERMVFAIPNSHHIPLGDLKSRINELDRDKLIIVYCSIGVRSYNAARTLSQNGFNNVKVLSGGTTFYKSMHYSNRIAAKEAFDKFEPSFNGNESVYNKENKIDNKENNIVLNKTKENKENFIGLNKTEEKEDTIQEKEIRILDCSGLQCPGPIMKVNETLSTMKETQVLKVSATDMGFAADIESWCRRTGNTLIKTERVNKENIVYIKKGANTCLSSRNNGLAELPQGKTLIVFSGDLDKVLASFIIANGAAAMGRKVTMFFTFWGLNALRKTEKKKVKKSFLDKMFGAMMPRGTKKLKLSKMHMGGMGTAMMKKVMKDKNVDTLEDLMKSAMDNGVKIVACTMSMDVMGIKKEELIDGIEYAGVAAYLGDAEESNVNLFI